VAVPSANDLFMHACQNEKYAELSKERLIKASDLIGRVKKEKLESSLQVNKNWTETQISIFEVALNCKSNKDDKFARANISLEDRIPALHCVICRKYSLEMRPSSKRVNKQRRTGNANSASNHVLSISARYCSS